MAATLTTSTPPTLEDGMECRYVTCPVCVLGWVGDPRHTATSGGGNRDLLTPWALLSRTKINECLVYMLYTHD